MKKIGTFFIIFVILMNISVYAEKIYVDNKLVKNIETVNKKGRVLVPFKAIMKELDVFPDWNKKTKTVTAKKDDLTIKMVIGKNEATISGEKVTLDAPPQIIDDYTYVPIRFLGEALGKEVKWVKKPEKAVYLTDKEVKQNEEIINATSKYADNEIHISKTNDYYTFVDKDNNEIMMGIFEDAEQFKNGMARAKQNDLWGIINKEGKNIVSFQYSALGECSEGMIGFMNMDGTFGYIDTFNKMQINPKFDYAGKFENGKALVMKLIDPQSITYTIEIEPYMSTALMEQAKEQYSQRNTDFLIETEEGNEDIEDIQKQQKIDEIYFELKEMYAQEIYREKIKEDPAYNIKQEVNERWMYININGYIIQDNVQITEEQRAELIEQYL